MVREGETKRPDILMATNDKGPRCFYVFSTVYGDFYTASFAYLIKKTKHLMSFSLFLI